MEIVHLSSEFAPYAKAGGLGDVIQGLAKAQVSMGDRVSVIIPAYGSIDREKLPGCSLYLPALRARGRETESVSRVFYAPVGGVDLYLIDCLEPEQPFSGRELYGSGRDIERFTLFSLAASALIGQLPRPVDVVHVHDWATAIALRLLDDLAPRKVLTVHNLAYQGWTEGHRIARYLPTRCQVDCSVDVNLLREGLTAADYVTTVSPSYREEVLTPSGGMGLDGVLKDLGERFVGILNGIDREVWNPATDRLISSHYGIENVFEAKAELKRRLQMELRLELSEVPLICSVTRLTHQKGLQLIEHMIHRAASEERCQFVLLGVSLEPEVQAHFQALKERYFRSRYLYLHMRYDDLLSHHVYAASDAIFIPSLFEPCGLTQMIAMRYGTLPIARQTGGLGDSITDIGQGDGFEGGANGFLFRDADASAVDWALARVIDLYSERREQWDRLVRQAMQGDFGWESSAKRYRELYQCDTADL